MTTLNEAIETVLQLPQEQQEMLLEIIQRRHIEERRREIASEAQASLGLFRAGELRPQSAQNVIAELRSSYNEDE
ncbi:MAG: hypothetical protein WAM60_12480 [Candidatus Promineifilaceae bacterium]